MFIREQTVRLIDEEENMMGVVDIEEARRLADEAGMDLVEIAPDSDPPVCRIVDYGRYKYELSKRERANKAKSKTFETKEVRLGRSMKIDPHDVQIRLNQARKFLIEGHKVLIVQNFKGREMVHKHRGVERMQDIIQKLDEVSRVETPPRSFGRRMTMILAPDKIKIDKINRRLASQKVNADRDAAAAELEKAAVEDDLIVDSIPAEEAAESPAPVTEAVAPDEPVKAPVDGEMVSEDVAKEEPVESPDPAPESATATEQA